MGFVRLGRLETARRYLEAAIRLSPDNRLIERALAELEHAHDEPSAGTTLSA